MKSLVLESKARINLRELKFEESLGPRDVAISIDTVGICGSDIHYYRHGRIGPFVVRKPIVLGHEASGIVSEVGSEVTNLVVGDRVTMEPGIPDYTSKATRIGKYNLDPSVRFWATPPNHGVLRPSVIHPADFTYRIPDSLGFDEAAMVEPLAVGMHAVNKANIKAGDTALVIGAGPIGMLTAISAVAAGCTKVIISDPVHAKLKLANLYDSITGIPADKDIIKETISEITDGWGVDKVFECSGSQVVCSIAVSAVCPGGCIVFVGMPGESIQLDLVAAQAKEVQFETVFRYAHIYPHALNLLENKRINIKPLITDTFPFEKSVEAFKFADSMPETSVKVQVKINSN